MSIYVVLLIILGARRLGPGRAKKSAEEEHGGHVRELLFLGLSMGCGQPLTLMLIYDRAPRGRSGEAIGLRMTLNNFQSITTRTGAR